MLKKILMPAALLLVLLTAAVAQSQPSGEAKMSIAKEDTIRTVLSRHAGKAVTLQLASGNELSGTVAALGDHVVHLEKLAGKDFYDAVVDLDQVAAVVVRAR